MTKRIFLALIITALIVPACTPVKTADLTPLPASVTSPPTVTQTPNPGTSIPYPPPLISQTSIPGSSSPYPPPSTPFLTPTLTPSTTPTNTLKPTLIRPTPTLPPSLSSLKIAFCNDNKLWLWQNGEATFLTDLSANCQPRLSSDGKEIAFKQKDGMWIINSDGSDRRLLISVEDLKTLEPKDPGVSLHLYEWIPKTHALLFNTRPNYGYGMFFTDDLYLANADLMQWTLLRKPGEGGTFFISPDGQHIALVTPKTISVMNSTGGGYRTLLEYQQVMIPSEFAYYAHPVWASDSKSLMVDIPPYDLYYHTQSQTTIWQLFLIGTQPKMIAELPARTDYIISPDFSKVASAVLLSQIPDKIEFHVSNIDGSEDTIYLKGTVWFETWARDSDHFVVYADNLSNPSLGKVGEELFPLSEKFIRGSFSWIDGTHYIFLKTESNFDQLKIGVLGEPSILIATEKTKNQVIGFDFVK